MNLAYTVAQATIHDLDDLAALFDRYRMFYKQPSDVEGAKQFLWQRFNYGQSVIFIARALADRQAVGFTQLYPTFSSISMQRLWVLNDLYVREEHRQQGIAEQLLQQGQQWALQTKAKGVALSTATDNVNGQALYEKFGFVKDTEFYHYFLSVPQV
ncbi:GNAT family N-acetyltransferase [Paenibacillus campi]|uniref:GNAT family N-acetyltransferase n=1 Tax=Paenibacillus campi TaxID=3106031 RepID=UPI002AFF10AC|nr:GNAT family N-acetyltransferase [Paenibacillus sp. SGZ-1014]